MGVLDNAIDAAGNAATTAGNVAGRAAGAAADAVVNAGRIAANAVAGTARRAYGHMIRIYTNCRHFIIQTARWSYNFVGNDLYPLDPNPGSFEELGLNKIGVGALFWLVIAVFLLSFLVIPFLGNGKDSFLHGAWAIYNLIRLKDPKEVELITTDKRSLIQKIYGIPGYILGLLLGLFPSAIALLLRLVSDSLASCAHAISFFTEDEKVLTPLSNDAPRSFASKYLFGFIGLLLGGVIGWLIATGVSFGDAFGFIFSRAWNFGDTTTPPYYKVNDKRHLTARILGGILGYPLGAIAGALFGGFIFVLRCLKQSCISIYYGFANATNLALAKKDKFSNVKDNRITPQKWMGCLGIGIGYVSGALIGIPLVSLGRFVSNTCKSAKTAFLFMIDNRTIQKAGSAEPDHPPMIIDAFDRDKRSKPLIFGVGFFGVLIGGAIGWVITTLITSYHVFLFISSRTLYVGDDTSAYYKIDENDKRHPVARVFGGLGYIIGGLVSIFLSCPLILLGRLASNTGQSIVTTFKYLIEDEEREKTDEVTTEDVVTVYYKETSAITKDGRSNLRIFGLGFIGVIIGGVIGWFATTLISFGHVFRFIFSRAWNFGDDEPAYYKIEANDKRHLLARVLGGIFGYPLAAIAGALIGGFAFVFRCLGQLCISFYRSFARVANVALAKDDKLPVVENRTTRKQWMGGLGLVIGYIVGGLIGIPLVSLGRFVTNSCKSVVTVCKYMVEDSTKRGPIITENRDAADTATPTEVEKLALEADGRSKLRIFGVGFIGVIIGGVIGWFATTLISFGHAFSFILSRAWNFGDENADSNYYNIGTSDKRHLLARVLGGFLGYPLAAIAGALIGGFAFVLRCLGHSCISFYYGFLITSNFARQKEDDELLSADKRTYAHTNMGTIGLIAGCLVGALIGIPFVLLGRFINNNFTSGYYAFMSVIKHNEKVSQALDPEAEETTDTRHWFARYVVGGIGGILGGIFGALLVMINHSFISLTAWSGSYFNVAFKTKIFDGVVAHDRTWIQKIAGTPGFLLALPIGAFALLIRGLRAAFSGLLTGVVLLIGFAVSPLIAAFVKSGPDRSLKLANENEEHATKFKNIYSSLNAYGDLNTGEKFTAGEGIESAWSQVRRYITFGQPSVTEETIEAIRTAYANKKDIDSAVGAIKERHSNSCFSNEEEKKYTHDVIDGVAAVVREHIDYGLAEEKVVKKDLYNNKHAYDSSAAFWRKEQSPIERVNAFFNGIAATFSPRS